MRCTIAIMIGKPYKSQIVTSACKGSSEPSDSVRRDIVGALNAAYRSER